MKKSVSLLIITTIFLTLFTACKKDKGDPPVLPPPESMAIDFSNFENGTKGDALISIPKGAEDSYWQLSASAALLWKAIIYTTLAVPVYSFQLAVEETPVYLDDKTWQWSCSATLLNVTYGARLTGQITETNVVWKMYITKEGAGGFTDFLWFDGTSEFDGTEGQWRLYESPLVPVKILQIDWSVTGDKVGMIKYTYTKSGAYEGNYIEYGLTTNALNAYYKIHYYNSSEEKLFDLDVEWSTTLHNGRVKCPVHFQTSNWYCWDSNHLNITCP